mgnify:CR=1 FL=1
MLPLRRLSLNCFNTQPPEGGWAEAMQQAVTEFVSTRSRPKAAGDGLDKRKFNAHVSTRSRPKAAGTYLQYLELGELVSTRSRPKAAGKAYLL